MIDTAFAWLNAWWPLMALPGAYVVGFGMGWWLQREDMRQARRELHRRAAAYDELATEAVAVGKQNHTLNAQVGVYKRDWQALRAIVEQHTVKP